MQTEQSERPDAIAELAPMLRRVIASRVRDPHTVEDLVQETLTRLLQARSRLTDDCLAAYAATTARNLVYSMGREEQRHRRHAHRLVDFLEPDRPEDQALRGEDIDAVNAAVRQLTERERDEVVSHEVHGERTASLAARSESTPGAVAVRLAETRAKLRVDYLLALQGREPPTERCRSVLISLSSGNRRRQRSLHADDHLLRCGYCSSLSEPVVQRRRPLAVLWPLPALVDMNELLLATLAVAKKYLAAWWAATGKAIGALLPTPAAKAAAAAVTTVAVGLGGAAVTGDRGPPPAPERVERRAHAAPTLGLTVAGTPVAPREIATDSTYAGARAEADDVPVIPDLGDEGFWFGSNARNRVWVEIVHTSGESRFDIDADDDVSFVGTVVAHGPAYANRVGVDSLQARSTLRQQTQHIEVRSRDIVVR